MRRMLPPDYHLHTPLCRHARGEPVEYAARAASLGLTEIGFADHSPMRRDDFDDWRMKISELDQYVEKVERARREFPQLTIKLSLEVDYLPGHEPWIRELAERHPWDYLIGSVHYVTDAWALDNPGQVDEWKSRDILEVWRQYTARLELAAASGLFHIIGHADLCKRFGFYPPGDWLGLFDPFLRAARAAGAALEINTGGLRKSCREMYPHPRLLEAAARLGIPLTFGSDAHAPEEVGMHFPEALALARAAGCQQACRFTRGRREPFDL